MNKKRNVSAAKKKAAKVVKEAPVKEKLSKLPKSKEVNFELLEQVNSFMQDQNLVELRWDSSKVKLHLRRPESGAATVFNGHFAAPPIQTKPVASVDAPKAVPKVEPKLNTKKINSPFVGTFYRAPSPNQKAFVEVGEIVKPGDSLCVIEAMKLMNEIESDLKGRIAKVLVDNGTPVEYGEPLFEIEPL